MNHRDFRDALARLGLRQVELARLIGHLGGAAPDTTTVNRWAKGSLPVPAAVAAVLALWELLPGHARGRLRAAAGLRPR
ncbi:MAG TPA: hypothetical protein VLA52_14540 [Thermohalobaculum sp.]|nr:hypothetical protein [Thermohalobaculum sp.]